MKIFAALIASLMLLDADAACPRSWQSHRKSCYFVIHNEKSSWPKAMMYCQAFGGYLVDINDAEEGQYVRELATSSGAPLLWIGVTDIQDEGEWSSAFTNEPVEYQGPWGQDEPNGGSSENCVVLWQGSKYQWADVQCNNFEAFICERPATGL